ncbi:hypothetical protein [Rhodococcus sp. NPDC059234]|uniref:hypothetical protein n=1 Tax=Rhodococcus sp. NPDC059234 TaxID=3346781 RepID=UPI00366FF8EB
MNSTLKRRIEQVRQRWWVVLAITVFAIVGAFATSHGASTTYVAKAALIVSSPGRPPEQDAVLVQGYVTYFNDPATQEHLRAADPNIPAGATFQARTAAASPILYVEATAHDRGTAQSAAELMAEALRDDVNAVRTEGTKGSLEQLTKQLDAMRATQVPGVLDPSITALQDRIDSIRFDSTNQLQDLQLRAGVTEVRPKGSFDLLLAAVGGLILGTLAALALATVSTRLRTLDDVREKTDVEPLVEVPRGGSDERNAAREDRLRQVANMTRLADLPRPTVVAVTETRNVSGARTIARALAELPAIQGDRTILVQATPSPESDSAPRGAGLAGVLADDPEYSVQRALCAGNVPTMSILPPGELGADPFTLFTPDRIAALVDSLRSMADMVVIEAPSISKVSEAQVLCAAADCTILVIAKGTSRAGDVDEAARTLTKAHALLLGAVMLDQAPGRFGRGPSASGAAEPEGPAEAAPAGEPEVASRTAADSVQSSADETRQ